MHSKIVAIEYVYPDKSVSNDDLKSEFTDYDFESFEKKVGIKKRYVVDDNTTSLDLAVKACKKLFERIDKTFIDYILFCTQSPEYILPTTACILQSRLELGNDIGALDFNLGCSGYVYGLSLAKSLIESNQAKNVLLVTAETYSKFIHKKDRSNRALFGDAASCTLISESFDKGLEDFLFGTDGAGYDKLIIKNGGARNLKDDFAPEKPYGTDNIYTDNNLYMNGPEIFNFTAEKIPGFTMEVLKKNSININKVDQFIFHQANAFMLNFMRKKLKIDQERFFIDLEDGGNTVSNTIPIALKKYAQEIEDNTTESIVIVGFGVGLSWAGGLVKIDSKL